MRVQVMVELTEREQRALAHCLGRKVLLRVHVKGWGLELVREHVAKVVQAHHACECRRWFPERPPDH